MSMRYNWFSAFSVLSAAPLCSLATPPQPHWGNMRVKHAWDAVPLNWEHLGHPAAESTIDLHIALKSQRENALIEALYEVSTPGHPKYGKHLSKGQVSDLVAPHRDTLELINSWFEYHRIPSSSVSTSHGGDWLTLTGVPVSQANALLGASYQLYQHTETEDRILRTLSYALPAALHAHVKTVAPTTYFGSPRTQWQRLRKRSGRAAGALAESTSGEPVKVLSNRLDSGHVTPQYLRELYNTLGYVPAAKNKNKLGIAGYLGDYPSDDDLTAFMNKYRTDAPYATYEFEQIGDEVLPTDPHEEANVDLQYASAIAYPTPLIYYSTPGKEGFLRWLNYMTDQEVVPQTISTSYDGSEQDFSEDYAFSVCREFAKLGVRGVSVIFASGDDAVGREDCKVNDDSGRVQFLPTFPASCPWVTSVGGTIYHGSEVAAPFSSGGFSNYFEREEFQDDAVSAFLEKIGDKYQGLYNATSRGFPDIAAQADDFLYIFQDKLDTFWGTSCSAPVVAGVISLLNDYLISKGKKPLGWLNPWLYSRGKAGFNDITSGSNPGCKTDGFSATAGWDPVTGLGTPDFRELVKVLEGQK
ncbi:subtilisin-like protein [Lactarius indigo]|nr:subtilisin-like protein [Lactarius indigo]